MAISYPMVYETLWLTQEFSTTATPGHGAVGPGGKPARGGSPVAGLRWLGLPLAARLGDGWRGGLGAQARAWRAAQVDRPAPGALGAAVAGRGQGQWLSPRVVDLEAH